MLARVGVSARTAKGSELLAVVPTCTLTLGMPATNIADGIVALS